jgi:hypothetical protein
MSAKYDDRQQFSQPVAEIQSAVREAFHSLGAKNIDWSSDGLQATARTGISWWSWGERMSVLIGPSGDVRVRSRCAFPMQVVDWGKNEENCRVLLGEMSRALMAEAVA